MASDPVQRLIQEARMGHDEALRTLVGRLTPVIQARVARVVLARAGGRRSAPRQTVEDLTQEVLLLLFADDARVLRGWEPERGLSIENFAGLVATRRAVSILRTGKQAAWLNDPTLADDFDPPTSEPSPERRAASRQELTRLLDRLRETLSPLGWRLFDLLLIRELPVAEVQERTGMSREAVYAWRSRLKKQARQLLDEVAPPAKNDVRKREVEANEREG